jgi:hypothetical protein
MAGFIAMQQALHPLTVAIQPKQGLRALTDQTHGVAGTG